MVLGLLRSFWLLDMVRLRLVYSQWHPRVQCDFLDSVTPLDLRSEHKLPKTFQKNLPTNFDWISCFIIFFVLLLCVV